jgi:mannosyltransferase
VRLAEAAGLFGLIVAALALRTGGLANRLWMDEAISIGIASHPLAEIPGVLRLDGSPPLYYVLLHVWIGVVGRSESATHALSVLFAVLCVPAAWWAGATVRDKRTGWVAAVLAACFPFVTQQAGNVRMYTLVVLLGLVCVGCFAGAYVHGRRGHVVGFGVALALLLYAHNWALFLSVAFAVALVAVWLAAPRERRGALLRDSALGFGLAGVLYLPWLSTAIFQARHTGAPWATTPHLSDLGRVPNQLLGGVPATLIIVVVACVGVVGWARATPRGRPTVVPALGLLATVPVLLGWTLSQTQPAWAMRYLAIVVPAALLLVALALAGARWTGLAALAAVALLWAAATPPRPFDNVFRIARDARPLVFTNDLVVSVAPAQLPLLAYYLPSGVRFASPFGISRDPGVMDWRDALRHFDQTSVTGQLLPLLDRARPGSALILVVPDRRDPAAWRTPWARRVWRRADEYERTLARDPRFVFVLRLPRALAAPRVSLFRAIVFRRRA